jgi:hypothetical protein
MSSEGFAGFAADHSYSTHRHQSTLLSTGNAVFGPFQVEHVFDQLGAIFTVNASFHLFSTPLLSPSSHHS